MELYGSIQSISGSMTASVFTGSFVGDGSGLYGISASGVTGLNLSQIATGSVTASVSPSGLNINSNTSITGSLRVNGTIIAEQIDVTIYSSSVLYQSGSTRFGDSLDDNHNITGSVNITGSISLNGQAIGTGKLDETVFNTYTASANTYTSSNNSRVSALEVSSGSLNSFSSSINSFTTSLNSYTTSLNSYTSSNDGRVSALETSSGSLNGFTSSINTTIKNKLNSDGVISGSVQVDITGTTGYSTFSASLATIDLSQEMKINSVEATTASLNTFSSSALSRFTSIETSTSSLNTFSSSTNNRLNNLETASGSIRSDFNTYTSSNDSTNTTQNSRLNTLESTTGSLNSYTSSTNTRLGVIEGTTSSLNSYTSSTNTRLGVIESITSSLNSYTSSTNTRLNTIETATSSLNSFTSSINTTIKNKLNADGVISGSGQIDITQTTNYTSFSSSLATTDLNQTNKISAIESTTASLNTFTSSANGRLNSLESTTGSLNSYTSSNNTRLGVIESTTSSLNTYTASNNTRLGVIESTTSSLNTYTSSTNTRLSNIETSTGSLNSFTSSTNTRLGVIESTTASLNTFTSSANGRLNALETESGSIRTDFNTFTSSYTTVSGSLDSRLDVLEAYSSSQQVPTASYALRTVQTDVYCQNSSGYQINKGQVVRIVGASGDNPLIATASYINDNNSANTLGVATENIANGSNGLIITEGVLLGVNTSGMAAGDLIFLGATGSFINTAPIAPLHAVRLGEVLRVQQNNGSIYVRIDNGIELDEAHDVAYTSISQGDLLVRNNNGVWANSKSLSGSYSLTGSLTVSGSQTIIGSQTVSGSLVVLQNLQVFGSSSITYVTASQLALSTSFITVNVFEPAERFGGIKVFDSGSSNATASLAWDSLNNRWIYQNVSGALYSGGMLISGPRNTGSLGDEPSLTSGKIPKSVGGDHIDNSIMNETSGVIYITGSLSATGTVYGTNITAIEATTSSLNSYTASNDSTNTTQNNRLSALETSTSSINTFTSSAGSRLTSIETSTSSLNSFTSSTGTRLNLIETSTGSLNSFTSSTNTRLNSIETSTSSLNSYTSSNNTRLNSIETSTGSLNSFTSSTNTRLSNIETSTGSLNSFTSSTNTRLNSIETSTGSLNSYTSSTNTRLSSIETSTSSLNSYTASNNTTNTTQNNRLSALETSTGSLNSFTSSTNTRLSAIETSTSSLNSYTASNDSTNTTQNSRLSAIETSTGSLNSFTSSTSTRLGLIETSTGSLNSYTSSTNTRLGAIETSTGSLNSFTSSINTTIKNRLNAENVISGSSQLSSAFLPLSGGTMSGAIILGSSVPIRDNASEWILGKNSTTIQLGSTAVTNGISFQSAADSTFTYRGNNIWHAGNLTNLNQLTNGPGYITSAANWFGAVETGGTLDWNHSSNTRPGSGYTLLLGSATNGFSVGDYYHAFNLEYSSKDGTGNVTQLAISYGTPGNDIRMRGRYAGTWSSWVRILNSSNFNSFAMSGAGYSANQNLNTTSSPTFSGLTLSGTLNISGGSSGGFTNGTILWASGAGGGIKIDSPGTNLTLGTGWNEKVVLNAGTGVDMYTNNGSGTYTLRFALDRNGNQSITGALSSVGLTNTGAYSGSGGSFSHNVGNPASTTELFVHNGANTPVPFRMTKAGYTGAGGSYGILQLYMNDNTNGNGANLYFCANNSSSVFYEYGGVGMQIKSNTAGSETARLYFYRQNRAVNGTFDSDGTLYTVGNIYTNGNGTTTGNLVLNSSNYTSYGLTNNNDSEQIVGLKEAYWNFGSNRVYTDPRWNESGYDGDLGTLHIYSTTAAGVNYGRAGIALYNGSAYQYLTTKASTTGLFANNSLILTAGNYTSYAMQGAGYSANQNLNTSSGVRFATLQVGSTNSNGSLININGGNYNQFNLSYSSSAWGLLMGFGDGSASGGYHGLNHAAIINVQSGPIHFGTANSSNVQISSSGHLHPSANNTYDCGTASLAWRNVYTNDLHLSNMNKPEGNDVDGTNGNWTIQEGAENLYIINNNNGKKFKISLEEIK